MFYSVSLHEFNKYVNWGPLSETTCSGIQYEAKNVRITSIVLALVVVFICTTSGHLEWASTKLRKTFYL